MSYCRCLFTFMFMVAMFLAPGASSCSAQILNGGFETGDFSDWQTIPSGLLEVSNFAHTGQYSAHFGDAPVLANIIQQDLSLNLGSTYEVRFWVYNEGAGDDMFWVTDQVNYGYMQDPVSTGIEQWEEVSFTFDYLTPTNNHFSFWGKDQVAGFYVDDISVQLLAVPEPGLGCLVVAPLAGIGLIRRRRVRC